MSRWTVILHSSHRQQFSEPDGDFVFLDHQGGAEHLSRVSDAHLWSPLGGPIDRLPAVISAMTGLRTLSIGPGHVLPSVVTQLRQGDLPESLERLFVHVGGPSLTWPNVVVPNLKALYADGPFRFENRNFPRLQELSFSPQKSLKNVQQALDLPLEELNLLRGPFKEDVFALLEPAGLRRLGLLSSRALTSLTGIGALSQLESLRLKNLTSLRDISELATLERLKELDIQYCTKISGIVAINDLLQLRRLTLVGCKNVGLHAIQQKISTLEWANTGATT